MHVQIEVIDSARAADVLQPGTVHDPRRTTLLMGGRCAATVHDMRLSVAICLVGEEHLGQGIADLPAYATAILDEQRITGAQFA